MRRCLVAAILVMCFMGVFMHTAFAGVLPSTKQVYGEFMPSLTYSLDRDSSEEIKTDSERILVYTGFDDSDYLTAGGYLSACGMKCDGYTAEGSVLKLTLTKGSLTIYMEYDRENGIVKMVYPKGTRPEEAASAQKNGTQILPELKYIFGVDMPTAAAVLGRKADSENRNADGTSVLVYKNVTESEYDAFGAYAAASGCALNRWSLSGNEVTCILNKGGESLNVMYNNSSCTLTLTYSAAAYYTDAVKTVNTSAASVLPSADSVYGVRAANAAAALGRAADDVKKAADGTVTETYRSFGEKEYNVFSSYLVGTGCSVTGYTIDGNVMNVQLAKDGKGFIFKYDREKEEAVLIYPSGIRPDATPAPSTTPVPTATLKPTATPKLTATPTPMVTAAPQNYTRSQCYDKAVAYLRKTLKNPSSLQVHSYTYTTGDGYYTFNLDYSAMNGFGGYNRENYLVQVSYVTGTVSFGFSF